MLHFLAIVALCLFIGERVAHFMHERRMRKHDRQYIEWLRPRMAEPKHVDWLPVPTPSKDQWNAPILVVAGGVCLALLVISIITPH